MLQTKYQLPQSRPFLIHRPNLLEKLAAGLNGKLTLVSAPAGFGKTTLVTHYIGESLKSDHHPLWCWLSLDEGDIDPAYFFTYVIAALQTAAPEIGRSAATLLNDPQLSATEPVITILCNDLSQSAEQIVLVLDDYHFITSPAIHTALAFWLDHLPPNFHLILTSRSDPPFPLPRLRARGQLSEIRAGDLRFTTDEAADFLHQMLGLNLTTQEVAALEKRTEGWIAGLQLAALSIQGQPDVAGFIQAFTGSHTYILDYLADEVIQQQPPEIIRFLQDTAVLDQLSAPLCNALTGRSDSDTLLRQLYKSNLFLEALDTNLQWFRFHALFKEVLLLQLRQERPDDLTRLHRQASGWFAQAGHINRAFNHALAAKDISLAATLVEQHGQTYVNHSEYFTIRYWLEQLPIAVRRASPNIILTEGALLTVTGKHAEAEALIQETAGLFEDPALPDTIRGKLAHLQSVLSRFLRKYEESSEYGDKALSLLPSDQVDERNKVILNLLMNHFILGNSKAIESLLGEIEDNNSDVYITASFYRPYFDFSQGRLHQADNAYREILDRVRKKNPNLFLPQGFAYAGLGNIAYEWDNLEQAIDYLTKAIDHLKKSIEQVTIARAAGKLACARLAAGKKQDAFQIFDEIAGWREQMRVVDLGFGIVLAYQKARAYLQAGDIDSAVRVIAPHQLPNLILARSEEFLIHSQILIAQNRLQEALALLENIYQVASQTTWPSVLLEVHCQQALVHSALGDRSAAIASLSAVLPLAERENYRRTFLDKGRPMQPLLVAARSQEIAPYYLDQLLPCFSGSPASQPAGILPEPLTEREMELLQWVATGASNKDIAEGLFITVPTVKKHMSNILVKLDVTNRTQAITRAREIGLI